HHLRRDQLLIVAGLSVLAQEFAKSADVFLHPEVGKITAVVREHLGLRLRRRVAALVDVVKKELDGHDWRTQPVGGLDGQSRDDGWREPNVVSKVFVRVVERWRRFEIESRENLHARNPRQVLVVLLLAAIATSTCRGFLAWRF